MRLTVTDKKHLVELGEIPMADYSKNLTIAQLASRVNMSPTRFKAAFALFYGQPVHQYMLHKKMAFAHEKIKEDELTLAQIAKRCGYKYTTNFIAAFKKQYGYTPGGLRLKVEG